MLTVLASVFLKGFSEAIGLSAAAALPYPALNFVVLVRCIWEVSAHPALLADWRAALAVKGDVSLLIAGAVLVYPRRALGLNGFETGVSVMPLIDGGEPDRAYNPRQGSAPVGRVANARKLLLAVSGAVAVANTIAFVSEHIDPISIFIGPTRRDLMAQAVRYLLFGEGETGLMVYAVLLRYWKWTADEDVRPVIFLKSE